MTCTWNRYYLLVFHFLCQSNEWKEEVGFHYIYNSLKCLYVPYIQWRHWDPEMKWLAITNGSFMNLLFFLQGLFTEHAFPRARVNARSFLPAHGGCKILSSPALNFSSKTWKVPWSQGFPHARCSVKQLCPHALTHWAPQHLTACFLVYPLLLVPWNICVGIHLVDDKTFFTIVQ